MSDYRDKAAELRRQVVWASNEAIDIISQALLEAHKAGRAEERERVVGLVSRQKFAADLDGSTGDQYDQGYADASQGDWETTRRELLTAIRSIT